METSRLIPFVTDYIWGGRKLIEEYNVVTSKAVAAEAWLLSAHKDGASTLENGTPLCEALDKKALGTACENFSFFPILVKLIDAKENLSVQVHPSDDYALKNENSFGKTEMWYVAEAEKGAGLYVGMKKDTDKATLSKKISDGTVLELLNFFEVKKGDCFFIPAGTIHAIGAGCTICEVQQNSNLTYRLYDYNRLGTDGKPRELHTQKAAEVADLNKYSRPVLPQGYLSDCKYFSAIFNDKPKTLKRTDCFTNIVFLTDGGKIDGRSAKKGESWFIPAGTSAEIAGNCEYIEIFVKA